VSTPSDPAARPDDPDAAVPRRPAASVGDEAAASGVPLAAAVPGTGDAAAGHARATDARAADASAAEREEVVEHDEVTVRRAPKVPVFLAVGALAGLVVAFAVTAAFPFQVGESSGSTFGYMALWGVVVGVLVGGVVAIVLDRRASSRSRRLAVERRRAEAEPPVVEGDLEA